MPVKRLYYYNPHIIIKNAGWIPCFLFPLLQCAKQKKSFSRIGLSADAVGVDSQFDLFAHTKSMQQLNSKLRCVLIDEAQFLTKEQVQQLTEITEKLDFPVLAYGLRSDFLGEPFPGSMYLLAWADNLIEIKTICFCGKKATMNTRVDVNGQPIKTGGQIQIGGNESYVAMCRKHFREGCALPNFMELIA